MTESDLTSVGTPRRRSLLKKVLFAFAGLGVLLVILVAMLPTFINWGFLRGSINGEIQGLVNGTLTIDDLEVSWAGPLKLGKLTIDDAEHHSSIQATVEINEGLWTLITDGASKLSGQVQGTVKTRQEADGSLAIAKMFKPSAKAKSADTDASSSSDTSASKGPFPAGIDLNLSIGPLALVIDAVDGSPLMSVSDVNGQAQIVAGGTVKVRLAGDAQYLETKGLFNVEADADGLVAKDGSLVIKGTPINVQAEAKNLHFVASGLALDLKSAAVSVVSKDATAAVEIGIATEGTVNNATPSTLKVALTVEHPITDKGEVAVDLGGIHGTIVGKGVPTAPLQFLLGESPVLLSRDLGPTMDIDGSFSDATGKGIKLALRSEHMNLTAAGTVDPTTQAATLTMIAAEANVNPALVALAGLKVSGPSKVTLNANDVVVPARAANGDFPTGQLEFRATIAAAFRDAVVSASGVERPLGVAAIQVSANAKPVQTGVNFTLSATPAAAKVGEPAPPPVASAMRAKGKLIPGGRFGVHGTVDAAAIPSALIDPWLPEGLPLTLADDLGPVINGLIISADAAEQTALTVVLDSAGLKLNATGTQSPNGALNISEVSAVAPAVRPALLAKWGVRVADAVTMKVRATNVVLPPTDSFALGELGCTVEATITPSKGDAIALTLGDATAGTSRTLSLKTTVLTLLTKSLGTDAKVGLQTTVDGSTVILSCGAKGLLNGKDEWLIESAAIESSLSVAPVSAQQIAQEIPSIKDIVMNAGGAPYTLDATFAGTLKTGQLEAKLSGKQTELKVRGALQPESLTIDADVAASLTPALLAASAGELPFVLTHPSAVTAKLAGFKMSRVGLWSLGASEQLQLSLTTPQIAVHDIGGVEAPVFLHDVTAGATIEIGATKSLRGTLKTGVQAVPPTGPPLAVTTCDGSFGWTGGAAGSWNVEASLTAVNGPGLEVLMGMPEDSRGQFGTGGTARVKAQQGADGVMAFEAVSHIDQIQANVKGDLTAGVLTLQPSEVKLTLAGTQVVDLLNGANADKASTWATAEPLHLEASVKSLRMRLKSPETAKPTPPTQPSQSAASTPMKLPEGFTAVVDVTVKPLTLRPLVGAPVKIQTAAFSASAPGVGKPATVKGRVALSTGANASAAIALDATLRDWTKNDGTVALDTMQVDSTIAVEHAATSIVGAILGMGGELEEALGPEITAKIGVASTGPGTATITATADSEFLTLRAPRVTLDKGFVVVASDKPFVVNFQPSPPLRERLLEPINPVFTDITLADPTKPIVLEASAFRYPLDGDYQRLDADIQLRVGPVFLSRNKDNQILNMLKVWQAPGNKPVDGLIEPLNVVVRAGQLTYQNFNVNVEKQGNAWVTQLIFSGDIDLTRKPPMARAIAANYPMGSMARSVLSNIPADEGGGDLQNVFNTVSLGAMDMVQLRVSFSGPLGDVDGKPSALKRKVKVEVKPEAIGKGVGEVVKDAGSILKDIFNKNKK